MTPHDTTRPGPGKSTEKTSHHDENANEISKTATEAEGQVVADRLNRALSARQVQMIAIGGSIGTGLFLGSGQALATGGPASLLLCYAIIGVVIFFTMLALGEMAAFIPVAGSFSTFARSVYTKPCLWLPSLMNRSADSLTMRMALH